MELVAYRQFSSWSSGTVYLLVVLSHLELEEVSSLTSTFSGTIIDGLPSSEDKESRDYYSIERVGKINTPAEPADFLPFRPPLRTSVASPVVSMFVAGNIICINALRYSSAYSPSNASGLLLSSFNLLDRDSESGSLVPSGFRVVASFPTFTRLLGYSEEGSLFLFPERSNVGSFKDVEAAGGVVTGSRWAKGKTGIA